MSSCIERQFRDATPPLSEQFMTTIGWLIASVPCVTERAMAGCSMDAASRECHYQGDMVTAQAPYALRVG
jgi:hypothetical protein